MPAAAVDKHREGHRICIAMADMKPENGDLAPACVWWGGAIAHVPTFVTRDEMAVLHHKSLPGRKAEQESRDK